MPVPAPNLHPDFNTIRLSHVCLNVKNLNDSKAFYTDIVGLQVTDESDRHVYLRAMEERGHHCIILQKSDQPGTVEVMGFKTFEEMDLDKAETYFKGKGSPTSWVNRPYQGKTLLTSDNMGIPLEFYHKMDRLEPIHQKYALYRGVKPLRIDHFNCFSHDVDASVEFYNDFGFRVTEYTEDSESNKLWAAWMHRKGGVHDMAFTNALGALANLDSIGPTSISGVRKARIRLRDGVEPIDVLRALTQTMELIEFIKVRPTMETLFIDAVSKVESETTAES